MMRDIPPDTVVDERYRIIERIGSGGMADVYCAEDLQLGRKVALKLLHRRFAEDEEFVERFRREASSAAGLQHPNVVGVYDRGEWDGTYYIAMEYLEGRSLKQVVHDRAPLDPVSAIDIVLQVLKAARFAHRRGIIHRDLKPHNVMIDDEGRVKVTDFGIARAGASDMTQTGSIMGTAQYLSPEQAQGHAVGATSDLYAVGVVLYELLTGVVPFDGDSPVTVALKHVAEPPPVPSVLNPAVTPELDAVVARAMAKDPSERFGDAEQFALALEEVRAEVATEGAGQSTSEFVSIVDDPLPTEPESGQWSDYGDDGQQADRRRWPWLALLGGIVAVGVVALVFLLTRTDGSAVPDVVGRDLTTAVAILQNNDFEVSVQRVVNAAPKDRVLRQDPQPQSSAGSGDTITLTVSDGPGEVTIPYVAGLPQSKARKRLRDAGFKVRIDRERSSVKTDRAVRTFPAAGTRLDKNDIVTLLISSGPKQVELPDLRGKSQETAERRLSDLGLEVEISETESSEEDPGTVLTQSPLPKVEVDKGSTVLLTVAKESKQVELPSIVGDTQEDAASTLSALGFAVAFVDREVTDAASDGIVVRQSPSSGRKVDKGARVTLTVGRLETTTTTPTPTTTTAAP